MKTVLPGFCLLLFCFLINGAFADQVYTWTDKDGNMHITAEPPPKNARVKDVLKYEPKPDKIVPEPEQHRDSEAAAAPGQPESDKVREARARAEKARKEAKIARAKAEELTQAADKYIETHSRNEYMRRAHQYKMKKAADDARAAQEEARIAEEKAAEAEKKLKLAEENARDSDD
jgi:type IV secretory pathway VirB10-like protein